MEKDIKVNLTKAQVFLAFILAVAAPTIGVGATWNSVQNRVERAQETADRAERLAIDNSKAFQTINIRLERIQTVLERIDKDK